MGAIGYQITVSTPSSHSKSLQFLTDELSFGDLEIVEYQFLWLLPIEYREEEYLMGNFPQRNLDQQLYMFFDEVIATTECDLHFLSLVTKVDVIRTMSLDEVRATVIQHTRQLS